MGDDAVFTDDPLGFYLSAVRRVPAWIRLRKSLASNM
jgi:hypothetical protein